MVPGLPQLTGGDDDDLVYLILPNLHQRLLEKLDRGKGVERQPCPGVGQGVRSWCIALTLIDLGINHS